MKGIFKLFPVALAILGLASCSDEMIENKSGANDIKLEEGKLYVQIEGEDAAATRAGFITSTNVQQGRLARAIYFEKGDQMKVYHNAANWRPQYWSYQEDAIGQYNNSTGMSVFTKDDEQNNSFDQYTSAYGIFPANASTFSNEDRTQITFNLDAQQSFDYSAEDAKFKYNNAEYDGVAYKLPIPLWGYANGQIMHMKYLTAVLRIDIDKVAAMSAADKDASKVRYIILTSDNKLSGEFVTNDVDPDDLMNNAPALETAASTDAALVNTAIRVKNNGANLINDKTIIINIGQAGEDAPMIVYAPLMAGTANVKAYLTNAIDPTQETVNLGTEAAVIGLTGTPVDAEGNAATTFERGTQYLIVDDTHTTNAAAMTPLDVVKAVIAADKVATRDFTLTFTKDIAVKDVDGSTHNFYLDFTNTAANYGLGESYALKHNVTIKAPFIRDASAAAAVKLYVRTATSDKTLTIDFQTPTGTALDTIFVEKTGLNSPLELTSTETTSAIPAISNASSDKVTVTAATSKDIKTFGNITLDAPAKTFAKLIVAKGTTQVNLNNGTLTVLDWGTRANSGATNFSDEQLAAGVTIVSKGDAEITNIYNIKGTAGNLTKTADAKTSGNGGFGAQVITFKAVWDGAAGAAANFAKTYSDAGTTAVTNNAVVTASQLVKVGGAAGANILAKEIDLDNKAWTPLATPTAAVNGNYTGAATAVKAEIKNLYVKGLTTGNDDLGLFAGLATNVSNLKLSGVNMENGVDANGDPVIAHAFGALVGKTTDNVTITNVEVADVTVTTAGKSKNIGGVIGILTGASKTVSLVSVSVGTANITGYTNMGGLIGLVGGSQTVTIGTNPTTGLCSVGTLNFTQVKNPDESISDDLNYATHGKFIGSSDVSTVSSTITINVANAEAIGSGLIETNLTDKAYYGYNDAGQSKRAAVIAQQSLIGLSNINFANAAVYQTTWAPSIVFRSGTTDITRGYLTLNTKALVTGKYYLNYINKD